MKNIKYIYIVLVFIGAFSLSSKADAASYIYWCNMSSGNIVTTATLSPAGPFIENTTAPFFAEGYLQANSCPTLHVSLAVSHDGDPDQYLIPVTTVIPATIGQFPIGGPARIPYIPRSINGIYNVHFTTGVDEPNIVNNNPQFVIKVNSPGSYISNVTGSNSGYFYFISGGTPDSDFPVNTNEEITGIIGSSYTGSVTVTFTSADAGGVINIIINGAIAYSHGVGAQSGSYTFSNVTLNQNDNVIIMLGN